MLFLKCLSLQLQQNIATVVGSLTTTELNAICCFENKKKKKNFNTVPGWKGKVAEIVLFRLT